MWRFLNWHLIHSYIIWICGAINHILWWLADRLHHRTGILICLILHFNVNIQTRLIHHHWHRIPHIRIVDGHLVTHRIWLVFHELARHWLDSGCGWNHAHTVKGFRIWVRRIILIGGLFHFRRNHIWTIVIAFWIHDELWGHLVWLLLLKLLSLLLLLV